MKKFLFAVALALLLFAGSANAQLIANGSVGVTVQVTSSSVVTVTGGSALTIDPVTGQSNTITLNVYWNLPSTWNNVKLYSYFQSATAALSTTGGTNIPSSLISASIGAANTSASGPVSGNPCTYTTGFGTAGANCQSQTIASVGNMDPTGTGSTPYTVTYQLSILNYANNGQHLTAGSYSGVLSILAVAV